MAKKSPSERTTLTGAPITPLPDDVPYTTVSLCPECTEKVEAQVFEKDGRSLWRKAVLPMVFSGKLSYRTPIITTA
jgi:hypothetical protein